MTEIKKQKNVAQRLGCDVVCALTAGLCVAPLITPVDIAVTSAQSGKQKLFPAFYQQLKIMVVTPHKFLTDKPFLWLYAVYSLTYTANNTIDSICKIYKINDVIPKLVGVTAINMTISILKDSALARYFGTKAPGKVPMASYISWLLRDSLTMASAFIIPQRFALVLQKKNNMKKEKSEKVAQFSSPILLQTVLLPIHLIGLDLYNVEKSSFADRLSRIFKVYPTALPLRFFRMGIAYGIGGVGNKSFRNSIISKFEGENWDRSY